MANPYLFGRNIDLNDMLGDIFDTTNGHCHDGTDSRKTPYSTVAAGISSQDLAASTTMNIAIATIVATDAALVQLITAATAGYVTKCQTVAGTGLQLTFSAAIGPTTVSYVVFKNS